MSYNRVEINLLPPEFQPGPVVRYSLLINFVLIAGAITFIALNSVLYFWRLSDLHNQIKTLEQQKAAKESYVKDYQDLLSIQNQIGSYGRMICLTSSFYIDLPVVLDRVAKLIPDGVYLESISSARQSQTSTSSKVTIELNTSQRDPKLMEQTLRAFKSDPLLRECYMSSAEYKQQDITQLAAKHDVSWTAAGTDIPTGLLADQYSFSVEVNLPSSMQISGLPIAKDRSKYFSGFKLQMPVEMKTEGAQNVEAGAKAIKQGSSVAPGAAPAEVK